MQLDVISKKITWFLNSLYFVLILIATTIISYIFNLGLFPYIVAAISSILLLVFKANVTCIYEIFMLCIAGNKKMELVNISAPLIIMILLWSLALTLLLKELFYRRKDIKDIFKKDFILYSLIFVFIAMLLSLINTPCISDSIVGIALFGFILSSYFISKVFIIPSKDNQKIVVRNIILCGWIVFAECMFLLITQLKTGVPFYKIINIKLLNLSWCHQNQYTAFVNICILLSALYYISSKELIKKCFAFISIIVFMIINVFTLCRAGILALFITIIISIIAYIFDIKKNGWVSKKYDLSFLGISVLLIGGFVLFLIKKDFFAEIIIHFKIYDLANDNGRNLVFSTAIKQFLAHPIIGSGVNSTHYYLEANYNYHNYYLQMLGTCGIIGTIAFTAFLIASIKRMIKKDNYCIFVGIVTIYFLLHGLLDTLYFNPILMPALMVLLAIIDNQPKEQDNNLAQSNVEESQSSEEKEGVL